ncbi:MAG: bifunctional pyr operon transcriptional regulator/uracil phosphoribosyltransferase PyrR [Bacteroidia bacterium]|nr:bifunctional pyr operon transcriptional regulator/uracil phosphoribosyltransferase PyrR [Bacteroidia bacterium]MDW8334169.1 bifunctional pyr operon transcriptional regulator/uracil phosphoribosyltransferase PyrR [Bacteroidia bacterium]
MRIIADAQKIRLTLVRLALEIVERRTDFDNVGVIGVQPRGVNVARRIHRLLENEIRRPLPYGELDVTLFRDDLSRHRYPLVPRQTHIPFSIEGMNVILVDDVLFTGRTLRSAFDALVSLGRPARVELVVLVDRTRKRDFPIAADYVGYAVDTLDVEKVFVRMDDEERDDRVSIA